MTTSNTRIKYMLPNPEKLLQTVQNSILSNLRNNNEAKVQMLPLVQRAYILVNRSGVIPYKDYDASVEFLKEQ